MIMGNTGVILRVMENKMETTIVYWGKWDIRHLQVPTRKSFNANLTKTLQSKNPRLRLSRCGGCLGEVSLCNAAFKSGIFLSQPVYVATLWPPRALPSSPLSAMAGMRRKEQESRLTD